jgi:predicted nucleic acid-binding Zn ribbon protein
VKPELRNRVLSEWRGLPCMEERPDRFHAVATTLPGVMKRLGLQERLNEADVARAWREVVGEFLAAHSAPAGLRDGILIVHVLQPTVHFELERNWKAELLRKLRTRFGRNALRDIKFRLG